MERASKDVGCLSWECNRCGERWVREWGDTVEGEDIGYSYEGPYDNYSDSEPESEEFSVHDSNKLKLYNSADA